MAQAQRATRKPSYRLVVSPSASSPKNAAPAAEAQPAPAARPARPAQTADTAVIPAWMTEKRGWRDYDLPALAIPTSESPNHTPNQNAVYDALEGIIETLVMWPSYKAATPAERRRMRHTFTRAGRDLLALVALDDSQTQAERDARYAALDWQRRTGATDAARAEVEAEELAAIRAEWQAQVDRWRAGGYNVTPAGDRGDINVA